MVAWSDRRPGPTALERTAAPAIASISAAAAAHQSHVELILRGELGELEPDQRSVLEAGWRNGRRLLRQIAALQTVALAEAGDLDVQWTRVSLEDLLRRAVERAWPAAQVEEKSINLRTNGRSVVSGAEAVLAQSLDVLVDYAVEHARRGRPILISLDSTSVDFRYASSREPQADELPLALGAAACHAHGGELSVFHDGEETTLVLRFARSVNLAA
jgi:hypothetical protein